MNWQLRKTQVRKSRGAVVVEFALMLPIFVLLVFGTIEMGWALYIQNTLVDIAREATRLAVTNSTSTSSSINTEVTHLLTAVNIPTSNVQVTITPSNFNTQAQGNNTTVVVSVPYKYISILPTPMFLGKVTLSGQMTMVKEY